MDDCGEDLGELDYLQREEACWWEMPGNELEDYYLGPSEFKTDGLVGRLRDDRPPDRARHFFGISSGRSCLNHTKQSESSFFVDVAEIMGGEGRATQLLFRRRYVGG
eukprot:9246165-Pyramimonas_sp.AAC.1